MLSAVDRDSVIYVCLITGEDNYCSHRRPSITRNICLPKNPWNRKQKIVIYDFSDIICFADVLIPLFISKVGKLYQMN